MFDVHYNEGIFVGYRWYDKKSIEPLYHFGSGLSYTSFNYNNLRISAKVIRAGDPLKVTFTVTNTGKAAGSEIAQLYIRDMDSKHPRPVKELKGFEKISLQPGESGKVVIILTGMDFSYWSPEFKDWYTEPGEFSIMVGSSSGQIALTKDIEIIQ